MSLRGKRGRSSARRADTLPDVEWLRFAGVAVLAAKLALVPVVFDPVGEDAFGVVKSAVSRGLSYVLLSLGVAYGFLDDGGRQRVRRSRWIALASLAFAGVSAIATLLAVDQRTALFGAPHRYLGLTSTLDGVALAIAIPFFIRDRRDFQVVLVGLFGGAAVVIAYAGVQFAHLDPFSWLDPTVSSTLGNRGYLAGYLVVVTSAALVIGLLIQPAGRRQSAALATLFLASIVLVLASGARGPVLALPVVVIVAAVFVIRSRPGLVVGMDRRWAAVAGLIAAVVATAAFVLVAPRLATLFSGRDTSLTERALVYETGFAMVRERPLTGAGPDNFVALYPKVRPVLLAEVRAVVTPSETSAHSWPLHHAIGTGLVGLGVLIALVVVSLYRAWGLGPTVGADPSTVGAASLAAFLLQGAFNAPSVVTELMFWSAIGLCAVQPLGAEAPPLRVGPPRSLVPLGVALALGIGLSSTTVSWVLANQDVRASDVLRGAGKREVAERAALLATQRDPGRANSWNVLGLARERDRPEAALQAFARAVELAPYDSVYLLNLARNEALLGQRSPEMRDRSLRHARSATEIDPNDPVTLYRAAEILLFNGDATGALTLVERSMRSFPSALDAFGLASRVYEALGDHRKAADTLRTILVRPGPIADAPLEQRVRLAGLYAQGGDPERARSLFASPSALSADTGCAPANGFAQVASVMRPRCIRVVFRVEAPLAAQPGVSGSATDPTRYMVLARPLPAGSTVSYDGQRSVVIQLPASVTPSDAGAMITIRAVRDVYGNEMRPDPVELAVDMDLNDPRTLVRAGQQLLASGDTQGALALAERSLRAVPPPLDGYELASRTYEALGDARRAAETFRVALDGRGPLSEAPLVQRQRLARLYAMVGDLESARSVLVPPTVESSDAGCAPLHGFVQVQSVPRPRCVLVVFTVEAPLLSDGAGSARDPAAYMIDGRALPVGSIVTYDGQRRVVIQLPASVTPPDPGSRIAVRGVRDVYGAQMRPDPAEVTLR